MSVLFDCSEINKNNDIFSRFNEKLTKNTSCHEKTIVCIDGYIYKKHLIAEDLDIIVSYIRKQWIKIQNIILYDIYLNQNEIKNMRTEIINSLEAIINCILECECISLRNKYLDKCMEWFKILESSIIPLMDLEENVLMKITKTTATDTRNNIYYYFHTLLDLKFYIFLMYNICNFSIEHAEQFTVNIMEDLIILSQRSKDKQKIFICKCIEDFWRFLQNYKSDGFWKIFNKTIANTEPEFTINLLRNVAKLTALPTNYELLETKLKELKDCTGNLLIPLKNVQPLLCDLWLDDGRIEPYQILWDHFSKHLNESTKNNQNDGNTMKLMEIIEIMLLIPGDCDEEFLLFVGMLIKHLNKHPYHWGKMKGRIYSQLSPAKIRDLNNVGILHVSLLFIGLNEINREESTKKFMNFIENLGSEKRQNSLVWSIYTAFIIQHLKNDQDITLLSSFYVKMLNESSHNSKHFHLIKQFIEDLPTILNANTNKQLNQIQLLDDDWLMRYLMTCYHNDLIIALRTLTNIVDSVKDTWYEWESIYINSIYPALKSGCKPQNTPPILGVLAAKICVLTPSLMDEALIFYNSEYLDVRVSVAFLATLLEESVIFDADQEMIALKSWLRYCLLTQDVENSLTRFIAQFSVIPIAFRSKLLDNPDSLQIIIDLISTEQSMEMHKFCDICFGQMDRWIEQYLLTPTNATIIVRLYDFISIAFDRIGHQLYDKYRNTSPLTRLLSVMIFTNDVMIGKSPNPYVLKAINKTWPKFFGALIKLNEDSFIERNIKNLLIKFIPYFQISTNPFMDCLKDNALAPVLLQKISDYFLKHPIKEPDANVLKILRILNEFVLNNANALDVILDKILPSLFEVVIFHNQKSAAITLIKTITQSNTYRLYTEKFKSSIRNVTEKHLAFNALNYFQLMNVLARIVPNEIRDTLQDIRHHITVVEKLRGIGYDKSLRLNLERLEQILR